MSIQPKDLRYTITTDYGVTVLSHAPKGWDEGLIKWVRSEKYWGLFRSFSIPMQFALDGKDVLTEVYAKQGSEGRAEVLIERLDRSDWSTYKTYYNAVVDFSQVKWSHDYFECNLIEGGISQVIKAQETTIYNVNKAPYRNSMVIQDVALAASSGAAFVFSAATFRTALEALLYQMYKAVVPVYSELLDDLDASNDVIYVTTGRAIRTDDHDLGNFATSLFDMFQFLNSKFCCGMGVEVINGVDTVVIDGRGYFLQDTQILETVPNGREIEIAPAKQFLANKIMYGDVAWQPEDPSLDTEDRFAKECESSIPIKTVKGDVEASSKWYTDYRLIQYLINLPSPQLERDDNSHDNDIFACHVKYDAAQPNDYFFWTGSCNGVSGALNTWLSPKRALINWLPYLESICSGITETTQLPYLVPTLPNGYTGITVTSVRDGDPIAEDDILPLVGTGQLFKPYIFKLKTSGSIDLADILEANHNGYISFYYGDVLMKGHIMEMAANPSRRKVLELTLLAHKDTDLYELHPNYTPPI
jgi:hypothetical protein